MNKKIIKIISIISACLICLNVNSLAAGETQDRADALNYLGLFAGTDNGYELDKTLTRAEAITMIVRYLGAENDAMSKEYDVPFVDVPDWAKGYIGYAYEHGITAGTGDTEFSPDTDVSLNQYLTFLLRVLKYDDTAGDFVWNDPYELAEEAALISENYRTELFLRSDMVDISWNALEAEYKNDVISISEYLIGKNTFTSAEYTTAKSIVKNGKETALKDNPNKSGASSRSAGSRSGGNSSGSNSSRGNSSGGGTSASRESRQEEYANMLYNVTFYDEDGRIIEKQEVKRGESAVPPTNPEKSGYLFLGWSHPFYGVIGDTETTARYAKTNDENIFYMNLADAAPGEEITVKLDLRGKIQMSGFDVSIVYDTDILELLEYETNTLLDIVTDNDADDGDFKFNMALTKNITSPNDVMTVKFRIKDTTEKSSVIKLNVNDAIYIDAVTNDLMDCEYSAADCVVHIK